MRKLHFVPVFVALLVCVSTQSQSNTNTTSVQEIVKLDDTKFGEFFTTERPEDEPVSVEKVDESNRNLTTESLIDRIVDLAIKRIQDKTTAPIKLADTVEKFNKTFFVVPLKGEIILYNGLLNGVNTISRKGKTTFSTGSGHILVNTTVEFEELRFIYDFQTNIYKLSIDGVCKGSLTKLVVGVGLRLKITAKEIELTHLKLISSKTLSIQLDSPKFRDKVLNYMLKTITSIYKTTILAHLEKELQRYIGTVIHF